MADKYGDLNEPHKTKNFSHYTRQKYVKIYSIEMIK